MFYEYDFDKVKTAFGFQSAAAEIVRSLKEKGLRIALATNPIFPARATQWRIQWIGLQPEDFELYTTYEDSKYSKPIINKAGTDITEYPHGSFEELKTFFSTLSAQ